MRILIYFICFITVYDIYLTVKHGDSLYEKEKNPVAKLLIEEKKDFYYNKQNNSPVAGVTLITCDVSKLILFKMLGVIAAAHILNWILRFRIHKIVIPTVVLGQLFLLAHLLQ